MRLEGFFQTTPEEIDAARWNPYLGISIAKKTFTREYVSGFVEWALPRSRQRVAIVVVDVLQRINNTVLGRYKPIAALEKAFRRADEVRGLCEGVLGALPPAERDRVVLLEWPDIVDEDYFLHNAKVFGDAFEAIPEFREALVGMTRASLGPIVDRLDEAEVEFLSHYMLHELPEVTAGFVHGGIHFDLNAYPGRIASLFEAITGLECYPALRERLRPIGPWAAVELYDP